MRSHGPFKEIVTSVEELREIIGRPSERAVEKVVSILDRHVRAFIARSPFLLVASSDGQGRMDVSPKGDPAGFVLVLDDRTLVVPDRPGNRRGDTFVNVLERPRVALCFLIPGTRETLRVNGAAAVVRDPGIRERMAVRGKVPELALAVTVEEAFFHCPKCIVRSRLWDESARSDGGEAFSMAEAMAEQTGLGDNVDEMQKMIDESVEEHLY